MIVFHLMFHRPQSWSRMLTLTLSDLIFNICPRPDRALAFHSLASCSSLNTHHTCDLRNWMGHCLCEELFYNCLCRYNGSPMSAGLPSARAPGSMPYTGWVLKVCQISYLGGNLNKFTSGKYNLESLLVRK